MFSTRSFRIAMIAAVAVGTIIAVAPNAGAASQTYTVKVDGQPPVGQPWSFLRFFPGSSISVHQGDVVDFAFSATDAPHTVTLTGDTDPAVWRAANQAPGDPYELFVPDSAFGGDDQSLVLNPYAGAPTDPTCGTEANPCVFDSTKVVNSGVQSPNDPQPAFFVSVTAPVGSYSFLCLLHPAMETKLNVAAAATTIPTPQQVSNSGAQELKQATKIDGSAAEDMAQTVRWGYPASGPIVKINAGGFANNVSANEFPEKAVKVHVGDRIRFIGMPEIHTATFPKSAIGDPKYAFLQTFCEQTGVDTPAQSPADCSDPTKFETVVNQLAISPTKSLNLGDPATFRNSGLLTPGTNGTFVAKKPGTYTFICLVHGPEMSSKIKVAA
jgi:plastocyanin